MKAFNLKTISVIVFTTIAVNIAYSQPKSKKEVEALLDNFSISLKFDAKNHYQMSQTRCKEGWEFKMKGDDGNYDFLFVDKVAKKMYDLDEETKTGQVMPLNSRVADIGIHPTLAAHLFLHSNYTGSDDFKKTDKHETIAGRKATVYTVTFGDGKGTFWIDDEYGITLKYTQEGTNLAPMQTEVTELKAGGVTMADMVNLKAYKIEVMSEKK